ncbi:hypothetical protein GVV04_14400 [Micromonospora sp. NEAU-HG-1]|nr:hypothetical protein [Micromonospora rubida]
MSAEALVAPEAVSAPAGLPSAVAQAGADLTSPTTPLPDQPPQVRVRKRLPWIIGGVAAVVMLCCGICAVPTLIGDTDEPAVGSVSPSFSVSPSRASAPTSAAPAPKPKVYSGRGDDVVKVGELTELLVVKFSCPRCTRNTVLKSDGPETLMVNEIGSYTGKMWINLEDDALTTQFEVEARGDWTLTIGTIEKMATKATLGKATGRGDDVILLGGDADAARITHSKGQSNFVVKIYSLDTGVDDLLVNEIGGYAGTLPLQAPALVQVTAIGIWSISPH